jgi:hypothetical protein
VDHREAVGIWTVLSTHGRVLVEIARDPRIRLTDISAAVGLTERAVQLILSDLERTGFLTRTRVGRRNHYTVDYDHPFRHQAQQGLRVGPLLELLTAAPSGAVRAERA